MKPALIFLLLLVSVAIGQNVLVSFYQGDARFPNGWPRAIRETNNASIPAGWQTNMTTAEYEAYRASMTNAYATIQTAAQVAKDAATAAKLASLQVLFTNIAFYESEWAAGSNYTQAQMAVVIKNHNATLNQLKPFLKDLYLQSLSQ